MNKTELELLFSYNRWANSRILAACQGIDQTQFKAPVECSFGSLVGTLAHTLGTETIWRERMQGLSPRKIASADDFTSMEELASRWRDEEETMRAFLSGLKEDDLDRKVRFTRLKGDSEEATLWKALLHVILHGMQFRSEAGMILSRWGRSPGDLDLIFFLRDIGAR
jgi:uncharacterized damage-inducible protein DinB